MTRLFFLSVLVVCFYSIGNSQQEKETAKKHWAISFSPGIVPLPGDPLGLQPGAEFFFNPKISLLNEISLQTGKNKNLYSTALNKEYFKYKTEIRYYITKKEKVNKVYFGIQFTTAKRKFDVGKPDRYYETFQDDSIYTYNSASINSPVKTGTLQFGVTAKVFNDFYIDLGMGYGVRVINTEYTSLVNLKKISNVGIFHIRPISSYYYNGKLTRSQLNFGFRIYYRF
ncbi:MAG TPA: hypothetical protein VI548_14200 [Chitinophagaceae bacterium]|nr:hypothetical protein [Chitinophagaceae bacterium]